jgi:hypothetical protein
LEVELISKFPGVRKVEFLVTVMFPSFTKAEEFEISIPPLEKTVAPVFT